MYNYPLMVDLCSQKVVVIGAGRVAYRKIRSLLETGANIVVVSPEAVSEIQEWERRGRLVWRRRLFRAEDISSAFLVIAATDDQEVNESVARAASPRQLVCVAGCPKLGNFHMPSVFERGRLMIAVSTNGASPVLSRTLRDDLSETFGEDYETYLDFLYECREIIKRENVNARQKQKRLKALLDPKYLDPHHQEKMLKALRGNVE